MEWWDYLYLNEGDLTLMYSNLRLNFVLEVLQRWYVNNSPDPDGR